jgi:hypothetical protein
MPEILQLENDDIETTWPARGTAPRAASDPDTQDGGDTDGTDGADTDGTDGGDTDGTDGADTDGTDS